MYTYMYIHILFTSSLGDLVYEGTYICTEIDIYTFTSMQHIHVHMYIHIHTYICSCMYYMHKCICM